MTIDRPIADRCGICGERFMASQEVAEVVLLGQPDPYPSILVHQQCYLDRRGQYELA